VVIKGDSFADQEGLFNGTSWTFNKKIKQFDGINFTEKEYIDEITLLDTQTNTVIPELTFDKTIFGSVIIKYQLKEASTNNSRTGQLDVVTDGTIVSIPDAYQKAGGNTDIIFNASVNGDDIEIDYSSGANEVTMRVTSIERTRT